MKNIFLLACVLSLLIFVFPAQAVEVNVKPSQVDTYVNEHGWYTIEIYNENQFEDEFVITVLGPNLEWLNLGAYGVKMEPYGSEEIKMSFYPKFENSYEYEVLVYSKFNRENSGSDIINLKVLPERFIRVFDFSSVKVGDNLEMNVDLFSKDKRNVEIRFEVVSSNGERVKHLKVTKEVEGEEKIKEQILIDDLLAGDYKVRMSIPEHDIMGETEIYIPPVHKVVKKKEIISTPFGQEVIVTITNEGNVEEDYNIRETIPSNEYVDTVDEPSSSYLEDDDVSYNWKVEGLIVGGVETVSYNINYLPKIIGSGVVVLGILAILSMGMFRVRSPNIKKRYKRKRDGHVIVLEINGSLTKNLKNVLVKDRVSPLGKVLPEFEGPKPIVREGDAGTELIWRLGDIRPRSEIYLTYKVRPLIEAQLKMPRAYLTYRTGDDRKIKVFSKQILLE